MIGLSILGLMTLLTGIYVLSLRVVVPTNEVHIVQRGNKTISYGKVTKDGEENVNGNVYYRFPEWMPYIGVTFTSLPLSVFSIKLENYEAYDLDRLPFLVDIMAYFRVNDSNKAASRIQNTIELKDQITNIVKGSVRSIMANSKLEDIMSQRSTYGQQFTDSVKEQLKEWGVVAVKNIELMDVRDSRESQVIANIMAKKSSEIEMQSRTEVAMNNKKASEAEIEAQQEIRLKEEEAKQQVGMKQANVSREVGIAKEKADQEIKEQAKITKEKEMEVIKVAQIRQAEINKEANIVKAEEVKAVTIKEAEANKEQVELKAMADKKQVELSAEAQLSMNLKEAQGIQAKGQAEAEAKRLMELAPVNAQIELAKEIGTNQGYQDYLVRLEQIKALCEVGIAQAKNLGNANIKINAMSNDVPSGLNKVTDIFSPNGGLNLAGALETFSQSPIGKAVVDKFVSKEDKSSEMISKKLAKTAKLSEETLDEIKKITDIAKL